LIATPPRGKVYGLCPSPTFVHPSLPARSLQELIALAKEKPGHLTYASAGIGTSPHMGMELFKSMAGVDLVHVPFRGTGPAVTEMLSGRVPVGLSNTLTAIPHIEAGTLRALGVTGTRRAEALPKVPTIAEAGVRGYDAMQWYGLLAPAGTPTPIVERIAADVAAALRLPDVKERLAADGAEAVGGTPAAFAALIKEELDKWAKVARAAGIEPQ
jgi:tripartite-type tricarboxylate transporter receptor subunit TctC